MTYVFEGVTDEKYDEVWQEGKLASNYIGPSEILGGIGLVAYRLTLPPNILQVHPVFHVSMLRRYISDPSHVLQPHDEEVNEDLTYEDEPIAIADYQLHQLRSKAFQMVKEMWKSNNVEGRCGKRKLRHA